MSELTCTAANDPTPFPILPVAERCYVSLGADPSLVLLGFDTGTPPMLVMVPRTELSALLAGLLDVAQGRDDQGYAVRDTRADPQTPPRIAALTARSGPGFSEIILTLQVGSEELQFSTDLAALRALRDEKLAAA